MELDLTDHAQGRMTQRGVSREDVETILGGFYYPYADPDGNHVFARRLHGRTIRVVVAPGTNPPTVITVTVD